MTWSGRYILAAGVALGLSACNFLEGIDLSLSRIGCAVFPETKVGAVNWDTAWSVNMRIRQGEYRPMVLGFTAERPYVLRIANADDSDRMFRASGFFDSVAVGLVRVGGRDYETTCLSAVTIGPRETAEIWFVAKRDGRYEFEDQLVPYLFSQGASGQWRNPYQLCTAPPYLTGESSYCARRCANGAVHGARSTRDPDRA